MILSSQPPRSIFRTDWTLAVVIGTAVLFLFFGGTWMAELSTVSLFVYFAWLFGVILLAAFGVVRHADGLAIRLGEPLGTLILTLSVITIEVLMISAVMLTGKNNPTLARETMYSVAMIVLGALVGLALVIGGLKHREQSYNLRGANAYLSVIIPLAALGLILPAFTDSTEEASLSASQELIFVLIFLALYIVFLAIQTVRHREIFQAPAGSAEAEMATASAEPAATQVGTTAQDSHSIAESNDRASGSGAHALANVDPVELQEAEEDHNVTLRSTPVHAVLLLAYMIPVVLLAKQLAIPIDDGISRFSLPVGLGGFIVALLILSPEALSGLRAAAHNRLQRSVNLYLGSVAATIGLTIPAVLIVGLATGNEIVLGLEPADAILLAVTLAVSLVTFESRKTNVLHGVVHLVLFATFLMLIFD